MFNDLPWKPALYCRPKGVRVPFLVIFNGANSVANTLFGFFIFNGIKWLGFYLSPASVPNNKKARY